jgi:hypothetical protein
MEHIPSEADYRLAIQEIIRPLWNPNFHYSFLFVICIIANYLRTILILSSHLYLHSKWFFLYGCRQHCCMYFSCFLHVLQYNQPFYFKALNITTTLNYMPAQWSPTSERTLLCLKTPSFARFSF